jgi:hypothetical protein
MAEGDKTPVQLHQSASALRRGPIANPARWGLSFPGREICLRVRQKPPEKRAGEAGGKARSEGWRGPVPGSEPQQGQISGAAMAMGVLSV